MKVYQVKFSDWDMMIDGCLFHELAYAKEQTWIDIVDCAPDRFVDIDEAISSGCVCFLELEIIYRPITNENKFVECKWSEFDQDACPYCSGSACAKCGNNPLVPCDHDSLDRHEYAD